MDYIIYGKKIYLISIKLFLITNDTVIKNKKTIHKLYKILIKNKRIGILSPCSKKWGENKFLRKIVLNSHGIFIIMPTY